VSRENADLCLRRCINPDFVEVAFPQTDARFTPLVQPASKPYAIACGIEPMALLRGLGANTDFGPSVPATGESEGMESLVTGVE
jgi:hypothetical protein